MTDEIWTSAVTAKFEAAAESVREARRFVLQALQDLEDRADDAALLTSELATNAVIHAQSAYTVTVRREEGRVRVEVADGSPAAARRCHYSATSGTGRGLGMVEDTAAAWGIEARTDGKLVWFELIPGERAGNDTGGRQAGAAARADGEVDVDLDALLADLGGWEDEVDGPSALTVERWAA